jgi:hypothetical protein
MGYVLGSCVKLLKKYQGIISNIICDNKLLGMNNKFMNMEGDCKH